MPAAVVIALAAGGFAAYLSSDHVSKPEQVSFARRAPSPLSLGSDAPVAVAPAAARAQSAAQSPPPPQAGAESPDEKFMRLASSADPRDRAVAYDMAQDCMREAAILQSPYAVQVHPLSPTKCKLAQGHWQDRELRKRLLAGKVERAEFNAYGFVQSERLEAFADDRQAFKDMQQRAYEIGVENAEPIALMTAASVEKWRGEAYSDLGRIEEAKAAYQEALVFEVAAAVNNAKVTGRTSVDLSEDQKFVDIAAKLDRQSVETAIEQGRQYAEKWKQDLVDRALRR